VQRNDITLHRAARERGAAQEVASHLASASRNSELPSSICTLIWQSEESGRPVQGLAAQDVQVALEDAAEQNDVRALFTLGRALCSLSSGPNAARTLVTRQNVRRGVALLLRAADSGCAEAWLHLHALTSNGPSSVTNPEMAKFCLRKAVSAGLLKRRTNAKGRSLAKTHTGRDIVATR
jgi:hypothetical protein